MSQSPPNTQGQRNIMQITPQHAQQLFRHYQLEKDLAERAGIDTPEGKEHMEKAQKIKEVLMKYNRRQQMLNAQSQNRGSGTPVAGQQSSPAPNMASGMSSQMGTPQQLGNTQTATARAQGGMSTSPQQNIPGSRPNMGPQPVQRQQSSPSLGAGTPPPQGSGAPSTQDQHAKYQQVFRLAEQFKAHLAVIQGKLNDPNTPANEMAQYMQKERELSGKVEQCRRFAQQLAQQLNLSQGGMANQSRMGSQQSQGDVYPQQMMNPQQQALQQQRMMQQQQIQGQNTNSQAQRMSQPAQSQSPAMQQQMMGQMPMSVQMQQMASGKMPPQKAPVQQQPPIKKQKVGTSGASTPITNVNAAASKPVPGAGPGTSATPMAGNVSSESSRSRFQNMPIPEELNIGTPQPVSVKQNNRPSILNGNSIGAASLTTPVLVRPQNFELEGERVLNRRKLKELVRSVGADEGDAEISIDGDVEDLLLDLADEFITSVTSFACRLAKHRKSESLDVRDVQLHLERNWNIRIPGYSSDDIRTVRKFIPTPSHNTKLNGISINKSVNKSQ
ncbi:hypothetical protein KL905_001525 [Ogataea polymorpha]|nr:hypothetical protein KL908_000520 [Ogataea polymorpha]KAG7912318.1 hypothetical protein KL906_000522 [Ogataea polymorpha]KAG7919920.1 hypothetical protein KL927_000600 [Ogataea polymorpha]KAG7923259.1 hypothetical protein KL905_001525 [Ogataea polymorpha]KAG7938028.1 hypothetical protein KL934_000602 [Ogataea polymorpha]